MGLSGSFKSEQPPGWASYAGRDEFGLYADLTWRGAKQRMRWIPPGPFRMGSPDSEQDRDVDEGPVRAIVVKNGFWLADTPCTVLMWRVVMADASTKEGDVFDGSSLPMTSVSWDQARDFLTRLSAYALGPGPRSASFRFAV